MMEDVPISPDFRCGYVAIIGEPNVGKSTLMNTLLQQKISIVTYKPQTTRHKILGILSSPEYQIVFLDTPGIIRPQYLLHEAMMQFAGSAMNDADVVLFMIDACDPKTGVDLTHEEGFARLRGLQKPVILLINKVDMVEKNKLLPIIEFYAGSFPFKEVIPVSALKNENLDDLLKSVIPLLPHHPPYYPLDIASEHSERFLVAEIIREKLFLACTEEVPYSATVDIVDYKEREKGKTFISADIYVERDSQKGIVIGKQGRMLKEIGQKARKDIENLVQHPVFLELHVKVRQWRGDEAWLKKLGYRPE